MKLKFQKHLPDTDRLDLASKMLTKVITSNNICISTTVVLDTTIRSKVIEVARKLSNLGECQQIHKSYGLIVLTRWCTFIDHALVTAAASMTVAPSWKVKSLHSEEASTYTEKLWYFNFNLTIYTWININVLLWSLVLVPHIADGVGPPGFVTTKVSVWHWFLAETLAPAVSKNPNFAFATELAFTLGPVMTNILKSRRSCKQWTWKHSDDWPRAFLSSICLSSAIRQELCNYNTWHMLSLHLHAVNWHWPAWAPETSKWVQFSSLRVPHPKVTKIVMDNFYN